jgi:hypothetical protein
LAEECRGSLAYEPLVAGSRFELRLPIHREPTPVATETGKVLSPQVPAGTAKIITGESP